MEKNKRKSLIFASLLLIAVVIWMFRVDNADEEMAGELNSEEIDRNNLEDSVAVDLNDEAEENDFEIEELPSLGSSEDIIVRIGSQELTAIEIEVARALHEDHEDSETLVGMYVHAVIMGMLRFQYAQEKGIAPTVEEAQDLIDTTLQH